MGLNQKGFLYFFVCVTTKKVPDPDDNTKNIRKNRIQGLKGCLALLASYLICYKYDFDVLFVVLNGAYPKTVDTLGVLLTSLIVAGGSAGAILIFQGYLNLSKQGRDAVIEAKKVAADADKAEAEARKQAAGG